MAMINFTPRPLYAEPPPAPRPALRDAEVFALAANLRAMDDEFEAWLKDAGTRTFDEFCEDTARRRLTGGLADDAPGRRALRTWLLHWGSDWNGNESSGGL